MLSPSTTRRCRVFFFNRYVFPDHSATSQLVTDLAWHLRKVGVDVVLVGSRQRYDQADARLASSEQIDGIDIRRVGGSAFGRASLVGRAFDYLSYYLGAAGLLWREVRAGDQVVMLTDPPLLGVVLAPLVRRRGAMDLHWLQDLFPEVAEVVLGGFWRGWRTRPLRWLRDRSLRRGARVVAISTVMAAQLRSRGIAVERLSVIANWTDDQHIQPLALLDNPLRRDWRLEGRFVIAYSGNLGRAHDWQTVLEAASRLADQPRFAFLLIGGGSGQQALVDAARARGLRNVEIRPYQPREALSLSLAVADVHWLSLHPALEGTILPSKLYGILAAARPAIFIGDVEGEVGRLLTQHDAGVAIAPNDVDGLVAAITSMASDPERTRDMGRRGRRLLDAGYTQAQAIARWTDLLLRQR